MLTDNPPAALRSRFAFRYAPIRLDRADGVSEEIDVVAWYYALLLAAVGGWRPRGTDYGGGLVLGMGAPPHAGSYVALCGERIAGDDAAALARGMHTAIQRYRTTVTEDGRSLDDAIEQVNDARLMYPSSGRVAGYYGKLWQEVQRHLSFEFYEVFGAFLSAGEAVTLNGSSAARMRTTSDPNYWRKEAVGAQERVEKIQRLEARRDRLVRAIAHGTMTEQEAAPQLAEVRHEIAKVEQSDEVPYIRT